MVEDTWEPLSDSGSSIIFEKAQHKTQAHSQFYILITSPLSKISQNHFPVTRFSCTSARQCVTMLGSLDRGCFMSRDRTRFSIDEAILIWHLRNNGANFPYIQAKYFSCRNWQILEEEWRAYELPLEFSDALLQRLPPPPPQHPFPQILPFGSKDSDKFTPEEDETIKELVGIHSIGCYSVQRTFFPNRKAVSALNNRWHRIKISTKNPMEAPTGPPAGATACLRCKELKHECNLGWPRCARCSRDRKKCIYPEATQQPAHPDSDDDSYTAISPPQHEDQQRAKRQRRENVGSDESGVDSTGRRTPIAQAPARPLQPIASAGSSASRQQHQHPRLPDTLPGHNVSTLPSWIACGAPEPRGGSPTPTPILHQPRQPPSQPAGGNVHVASHARPSSDLQQQYQQPSAAQSNQPRRSYSAWEFVPEDSAIYYHSILAQYGSSMPAPAPYWTTQTQKEQQPRQQAAGSDSGRGGSQSKIGGRNRANSGGVGMGRGVSMAELGPALPTTSGPELQVAGDNRRGGRGRERGSGSGTGMEGGRGYGRESGGRQ